MNQKLLEAFSKQKRNAKRRGIDWILSLDEWLSIWEGSGHIDSRGRGKGKYVMSRKGDKGPYSVSNVEIITYEKNVSDARRNKPKTFSELSLNTLGCGRGWSFVKGGFQVQVAHRYIGKFKTQEAAELAYQSEVTAMRLSRLGFDGKNVE